jgi:hypothetical protein
MLRLSSDLFHEWLNLGNKLLLNKKYTIIVDELFFVVVFITRFIASQQIR